MMNRIREQTLEYFFKAQLAPMRSQPPADSDQPTEEEARRLAALQPKSIFTHVREEKPEFAGPGAAPTTEPSNRPVPNAIRRSAPPAVPFQPGVGSAGTGPNPAIQVPSKIGRNDPCPCGSGKKYKKCCGA